MKLSERDYHVLAKLSLAPNRWFTPDEIGTGSLLRTHKLGYVERSERPHRYKITDRGLVLMQFWRSLARTGKEQPIPPELG